MAFPLSPSLAVPHAVAPIRSFLAATAFLPASALLGILAARERRRLTQGALALGAGGLLLLALGRFPLPPGWAEYLDSGAQFCLWSAGILGLFRIMGRNRRRTPRSIAPPGSHLPETEPFLGRLVEEVREYAIYRLDLQGRVVSWNLGAERITGWREEEVLGQPNEVFFTPEDIQLGKPVMNLERARTEGSFQDEGWRMRKDGSRFMAGVVLSAIHGPEGRVCGFTKVTHDITERLELESIRQARTRSLEELAHRLEVQLDQQKAHLQEVEARLQGFIQHAPAAIAFKDREGHLLLANRRAEALFGRSLALSPDRTLGSLFSEESVERTRALDHRVLVGQEEVETEERITGEGGATRVLLVQKFPLMDPSGHSWGLGILATDITERSQGEKALAQRRNLESLGLLAGGLAHDFNNLLGAILGNQEAALAQLAPGHPAAEALRNQETLISLASDLVAQILAYAGKGRFQVAPLDLNAQVEETLRLLRTFLGGKAALRWQPEVDLPPLEGDEGQIRQVIMNILLNSADAVAALGGKGAPRGDIRIRTWQEKPGQGPSGPGLNPALGGGPRLVLEISDNGQGISAETKERIFDPFFTTRSSRRGLGLSAVQGILRSHRGDIQFQSQEGRGTTVQIRFPAAPSQPTPPLLPRDPEAHPAEFTGTGTVLVADDERLLRSVVAGALQRMGFETLEAADGLEALEVFEANRSRIALILLDLTMPRMGGEEAYRRLRIAGATAPVLLTSGYGEEEVFQRFRGQGLAGFLKKPYRFQALVDAVKAAMAKK